MEGIVGSRVKILTGQVVIGRLLLDAVVAREVDAVDVTVACVVLKYGIDKAIGESGALHVDKIHACVE